MAPEPRVQSAAGGWRRIVRIYGILLEIMAWVAGIMIMLMMLAVVYAVFMRFAFDRPEPAVIELSGYLLLYITFLGAPWLLRQDGHVRVDLLVDALKPRAKEVLLGATSVLGALVGLLLVWQGTAVTVGMLRRGVRVTNILDTPQWLLMVIIPISGVFLTIEFVRKSYRLFKGEEPVGNLVHSLRDEPAERLHEEGA